jgi:hypothetical protein
MPRIELCVPQIERAEAIELGAQWNAGGGFWQVPAGTDVTPLSRWFRAREHVNVSATTFWVGASRGRCPHCDGVTALCAVLVPPGHQVLVPDDEPDGDAWEAAEEPALLADIVYVPESAAVHLNAVAPDYRLAYWERSESFCWMNHCEHCGAAIEDIEVSAELGSPFMPADEEQAEGITLTRVHDHFSAACGCYTFGFPYLEAMRRS